MKRLPEANSKLEDFFPFVDVDFIISDIDGTLISGSDSVIKQIKKTIKNLKQQRVHLTVATGRTFHGAKSLLEDLEIKRGMPIALYNGGVVIEYGTENVLYTRFLDCDEVIALLRRLQLGFISAYIYTFEIKHSIFKENNEAVIAEKVYGVGKEDAEYDVNGIKVEWIDISDLRNLHINAVLIDKSGLSKEEVRQYVDFLQGDARVSFTDSGNGFIEIKAKGLNKGIIFEILKNQNRYVAKKILAIGDNDNDQELFEYADISVAVANSSIAAKETAEYICENESANGFLDMLNVIKIAKKYCVDKEYKVNV